MKEMSHSRSDCRGIIASSRRGTPRIRPTHKLFGRNIYAVRPIVGIRYHARAPHGGGSMTRARVALIALGMALAASSIWPDIWSGAPRAQPERPAVRRSGVLGGAQYHMEVPAGWRGGLVVYAHGIQRGPGPGAVAAPPIGSHILGEGHAWIASGYRAREYQPHLFIDDLVAVRELFVNEIGRPRW